MTPAHKTSHHGYWLFSTGHTHPLLAKVYLTISFEQLTFTSTQNYSQDVEMHGKIELTGSRDLGHVSFSYDQTCLPNACLLPLRR